MSELHCPACGKLSIAGHCPSPTCDWIRCTNKACAVLIDPFRMIAIDENNKRVAG